MLLLALVPLGAEIASLLPLAIAVALLCVLIIVETISYGETRDRVRHPVEPETG